MNKAYTLLDGQNIIIVLWRWSIYLGYLLI